MKQFQIIFLDGRVIEFKARLLEDAPDGGLNILDDAKGVIGRFYPVPGSLILIKQ